MSLTDQAVITPKNRAMLMATLMLVTILHWMDITIAVVALPSMQGSLGASREQVSWVITSYIVAAAIATPPSAFISSRIGRKPLFIFSIVLFTISSILCGLSVSLPQLVFFRILQGVAGGLLSPIAMATILDAYPREKMGQAMATFSLGVMVGPILAPTLGGWLTEYYDWRWVFFINLPIGIVALVGIWLYVPQIKDMARAAFDWFGFLLLCITIIALQLMLDRGATKAWFQSPEIIIEAALACLCLYMFVVQNLTSKHPFISLAIFRDFNYTTTMIFNFLLGISMLAIMTLLPNFFQILLGIPPMTAGFLVIPRMLAMLVSMQIVGRLVNIVDPRVIILVGLVPMTWGYWGMSHFNLETGFYEIIVTGMWQGFGYGLTMVPLTVIAFSTLNPMYRAEASGLMNLTRSIASSIGISVMFTVLVQSTVTNQNHLREYVNPYVEPFTTLAPGVVLEEAAPVVLMVHSEVMRQATMTGYTNCFMLLAFLTIVTMPFVFIMRRPPPIPSPGSPPQPAPTPEPKLVKTTSPPGLKTGVEPTPEPA